MFFFYHYEKVSELKMELEKSKDAKHIIAKKKRFFKRKCNKKLIIPQK